MLVARRDPFIHAGAQDEMPSSAGAYPGAQPLRLTRFVTLTQLIGSLLAVPVGIVSAYSIYHANFSVDATCQNLRGNIVSMLDKNVDTATRRMLVRRDVETFEKVCAAVDPDATTAFKALLAAEKKSAPVAADTTSAAPKIQRSEPPPKDPVRKAASRPQVAKEPSVNPALAAAQPARRDSTVSDAQWLDAVRQALVAHKVDSRDVEATKPLDRPAPHENALPVPAAPAAAPAVPQPAPALPPAIAVARPAAQQIDSDHPVPPESIPDAVPPAEAAKTDGRGRSRIGKWISEIPLLGPVVDNARR